MSMLPAFERKEVESAPVPELCAEKCRHARA